MKFYPRFLLLFIAIISYKLTSKMYQPEKYKNNAPEFIVNFINTYPFATIIMQGQHMMATHVPVLLEGDSENYRLYAHIANHNPMCELLKDTNDMLIVFSGPNAYISSSWYEEPDIPTWDYTAVHINAKIHLQSDTELENSLKNLICRFENDYLTNKNTAQIPKEIWNENFKEITGFWLSPYKTVGVEKLHQSFKEKDITNIVHELNKSICPYGQIGDLMQKKHNLNH